MRRNRVSRARYTSPIPPAPTAATISYGPNLAPFVNCIYMANYTAVSGSLWSGRRDSNPRPRAWEAPTLPTELRPPSEGLRFYATFNVGVNESYSGRVNGGSRKGDLAMKTRII